MPPTLTENEVDALMTALHDGQVNTEEGIDEANGNTVEPFDLTSRDRIVRGRMPTLDAIHNKLVRRFNRSLSNLLCSPLEISVEPTRPMKLGEFLSYQSSPGCINLISLHPLLGTGMLCIDPQLFFSFLNLVFGGKGNQESDNQESPERDFTPVEVEFARSLVEIFCADAESEWSDVHPVKPTYLSTEMSPKHLTIGSASDVMMVTNFTVLIAGMEGRIELAIPYTSLEPIKHMLVEHHTDESADDRDAWHERLWQAFLGVPLRMQIELGRSRMSFDHLLSLSSGDVIRLDKNPDSSLRLQLGGLLKGAVNPLEKNGNLAFEFSEWRTHDQ